MDHLLATGQPAPSATSTPSFEVLYAAWYASVSGWVHALGAPAADHDDLVQEVFLVAHRRLAGFDGQNPAGWLYQIARRKVRDHRRLVWVQHVFGRRTVPVAEDMLTTNQGPLAELETKRQQQFLVRMLDRLNEKQRSAFVLFEIEGRCGAEIARIVGVPVNTVWLRLHRARKALSASVGCATPLGASDWLGQGPSNA